MATSRLYCGRFAPTPSGPLHFGSLVAAVASYIDAKAHQGRWLVRIEDVDKPRAVPGASNVILHQLEQHGLGWDGEVWYQSQRDHVYRDVLAQLQHQQATYFCTCTRKQIKARGAHYTGYCRHRQRSAEGSAVRFCNDHSRTHFNDRIQGQVELAPEFAHEDFLLLRRDQLYTYQLAVVVDDIEQGVTDIVRGADLLTASSWQVTLWQRLSQQQPRLAHVNLALDENGRKLSKQNHAPALQAQQVPQQLRAAFEFLGLTITDLTDNPHSLLEQATVAWRTKYLS
ncbi:Glutamyl-Q tRNA(Asp) synthetase [Pseudidiomarina piscicola]|uniref:Glutamyl-Q tRNA(Asp) synthetase n=1 Tax=Pseudidiomarina piscicola TaxID=2614830 RepID=A0A6S6WVJ3_9GAMM|nr:tRNA glutamyl-Q(34) synthetase GluQRS [Pseudidiomarina piscicola]CAB0151663.1 Glutamyl-Q tRNA(Asp) synthetase [Pseudidiomarina piscicola]VZT41128.1 Glutamyl-Q tRNA(Asp) synthetase [Pseudomonas aeruginosa]